MAAYTLKRLIQMIPALVFLTIFVFALIRILPGDPLRAIFGPDLRIPEAERHALEAELGLDKSIPVQYYIWLRDFITGDWGQSFLTRQYLTDLVGDRMPVTLQLGALSWLLAVGVGVPIGIFSALRRNSIEDTVVSVVALAGVATPNFLLGLLLIAVFSVWLGLTPTSGFVSITENPVKAMQHLALPAFALGTSLMAALIRQTRSAMLEVMNDDYIRTARAKGLSNSRVIFRHAMKNALLPVVTIAGLQVGNLASGTVIIETMFAIPGMGRATITAIYAKDYQVVQTVVVLFAVATMVANLVADLLYVQLDPRIRL